MRSPLGAGCVCSTWRPQGGVCDAVSECSYVDVLVVRVQFQARGAPFPMSARTLIPVADKLDDRMTRHRFALPFGRQRCSLAVREILGEVGFRELMQRGANSGVFDLETRQVERELNVAAAACVV